MLNKRLRNYSFVSILLLCMMPNANAGLFDEELGVTINVGIASKQLDLDVTNEGNFNPSGSITEGSFVTYHLSMNSQYSFLSENSRFGYYFEYGFGNFEMSSQNVNEVEVDLGTEVTGTYFHLTPVAFYNFGDSVKLKEKDAYIFGVGVGFGYLQAKGDIILTETTNQSFPVDVNGVEISIIVLMEYQHNDWFFRAQGGGPTLSDGGYEYDIFDFSMIVGYSFHL